jgi:HSP20 family protein
MKVTDLIPWKSKHNVPIRRENGNGRFGLSSDFDRVFEDFWRGFGQSLPSAWYDSPETPAPPRVDMHETDNEVEIKVELPGMDESDVDVSLADGVLTVRGEKKDEREKKHKGYVLRERSFGSVERIVPLPPGLDLDSATAAFKRGVLTVTIRKTAEAQAQTRRIAVRRG